MHTNFFLEKTTKSFLNNYLLYFIILKLTVENLNDKFFSAKDLGPRLRPRTFFPRPRPELGKLLLENSRGQGHVLDDSITV